jgi:hypothetical protein
MKQVELSSIASGDAEWRDNFGKQFDGFFCFILGGLFCFAVLGMEPSASPLNARLQFDSFLNLLYDPAIPLLHKHLYLTIILNAPQNAHIWLDMH